MQSAELALVHNVKSGWTDCGLHHLCPNAKIMNFMHILLEQWQYSYYAAQQEARSFFFLPHSLLLHVSNLYTNEYDNSVRDSYKKTQHCVTYWNKKQHLRSPITSEISPVCAAFNMTHSLSTEEVSKMLILKAVRSDMLHTGLPTFCTFCIAQWVERLRTDLSVGPISVPPCCYI